MSNCILNNTQYMGKNTFGEMMPRALTQHLEFMGDTDYSGT